MIFNYSRRVYLADTDAAGVVYFARGLEICHEAYEESLTAAGISLQQMLRDQEIALPITHAEIDFFRPLFCGDHLKIELTANQINQSELAIAYQIFTADNLAQALVKATTNHVCINPQIRSRVDLPLTILDWLENEVKSEKYEI